jgi:hypothetical protein
LLVGSLRCVSIEGDVEKRLLALEALTNEAKTRAHRAGFTALIERWIGDEDGVEDEDKDDGDSKEDTEELDDEERRALEARLAEKGITMEEVMGGEDEEEEEEEDEEEDEYDDDSPARLWLELCENEPRIESQLQRRQARMLVLMTHIISADRQFHPAITSTYRVPHTTTLCSVP